MEKEQKVDVYFARAKITIVLNKGFETLKEIVDKCPECVNFVPEYSETLLQLVAADGTPEMVEYLISMGSDINYVAKEWTALCWAICHNKVENVKILIKHGAEVNSEESVRSPLLLAIRKNNIEMVKLLIEAGADIAYQYKTRNNPWWDALSHAEYYQQTEIVALLKEEIKKQKIILVPKEAPEGEKERFCMEDYITEQLGKIERSYSDEEILDAFWGGEEQVIDGTELTIYEITPKKQSNYTILITSGMSEYPMAETDEGLKFAEVMMKIPKQWINNKGLLREENHSWVIKIMSKVAYLGHAFEGSYINDKVIIPYGVPNGAPDYFDWEKEFTSVMLCKSEEIPVLEVDEKKKIEFYTLVPISEEEKELVKEKGSEVVKNMLSSKDYVDMEREYLIEPEEW